MLVKMRDPSLSNPFVVGGPVIDEALFVGRERAFRWLEDEIYSDRKRFPLVIEGADGLGKTSFLKQITMRRLGNSVIPIYLDVSQLPLENLAEFLWKLSKVTMAGLKGQQIDRPTLEKRLLILRPWQAFNQHFWQKIPKSSDGRPIIFLIDNFDTLVAPKSEDQIVSVYRQRLYELFTTNDRFVVLFTLQARIETYDPKSLFPFDIARRYRLPPFSLEETTEILTRAMSFPVYSDLSTFLYELTGGYPSDLQCLCHTLHDYGSERNLRQITLADVLAVLETRLQPKDFQTAVYRRLNEISIQFSPEDERE